MTDIFKGKTWVVIGRFRRLDRADVFNALRERGAVVRSTVSSKTDYYVAGHGARAALDKARLKGITEFSGPQFKALLDGATEDEAKAIGAPTSKPDVPINDALAEFRDLVHEAEGRRPWGKICRMLDQCDAATLPVAVDYLEGHLRSWPTYIYFNNRPQKRLEADTRQDHIWSQQIMLGQDSPKLRLLRALHLNGKRLTGKQAANLFECSHLTELRYLDLSRNPLPGGFYKKLGMTDQFERLTHLRLYNNKLTTSAARGWAKTTGLKSLTHISLWNAQLGEGGFSALCDGPGLRSLTHINLCGNGVSAEDMETWAQTEDDLRVAHMVLPFSMTDDTMEALLRSPRFSQLEDLEVHGYGLTDRTAQAMIDSGVDTWRSAKFKQTDFTDEDWAEVVSSPIWARLETLELDEKRIGPAFARAMASAPFSKHLWHLKLQSQSISDDDLAILCANPRLTALEEMILATKQLGDGWARAVAKNTALNSLKLLTVDHTLLSNEGIRILAFEAPHLASLASLRFYSTKVTGKGAQAIVDSPYLSEDIKKTTALSIKNGTYDRE